ncbi:DUF4258 domain-containing protein [uncultured Anaerovibrio sp.]|uniref:DUF4258 domain-containing protein n=1 Tax=uncultured Anaerovibrio sp. TaxID=361586 RepID=UPI0025E09641|nr:DUF4258 domain-containing protein [uncultured Anaerovibrio sp.]
MIEIEKILTYYENDKVFVTAHATERFRQRGIKTKDIRNAVKTGEIIEQYPDDYPYPSCLIIGETVDLKTIHVVMSDEGSSSRIITAYYPSAEKWEDDLKTRRRDK